MMLGKSLQMSNKSWCQTVYDRNSGDIQHLPGVTDNVKLQLSEPILFFDSQMKNPDVSLETLKRCKTPDGAAERRK